MPYCSNCGREIAKGLKFCPECGAAQVQGQAAAPPVAQQTPQGSPKVRRPGGMSIMIASDAIAGLLLLIFGALAIINPPVTEPCKSNPALICTTSTAGLGVWFAAIGIFSLVVAWGYSRAEPWIRWPGMAHGIVLIGLGALFTSVQLYLYGIPLLLLGCWTVYQILRGPTGEFLRSPGP